MAFDANQRRQALRAFMAGAGLNVAQWESLSGLGDGTLRKFLDDPTGAKTLTDKTYARLAAGAARKTGRPVAVAELQGELPAAADGVASSSFVTDLAGNVTPAFDAPGRPMLGHMASDVPLYGTAMGGDGNGEFEMNGTVIDHVARPPGIYGRGDVFALNVVGDSMWPWRKPNSLIYVERDRAPSVNDHVVVEFRPIAGSNVRQTVVKLLVGISAKTLKLAQYRPPKEFDVDRKTVFRVYRVLEWDELMKGGR
jgi:phage repressor protein C with HTH and peptisase S24 domain